MLAILNLNVFMQKNFVLKILVLTMLILRLFILKKLVLGFFYTDNTYAKHTYTKVDFNKSATFNKSAASFSIIKRLKIHLQLSKTLKSEQYSPILKNKLRVS